MVATPNTAALLLLQRATNCAAIDEYAAATNSDIETVLGYLSPLAASGHIRFEAEGDRLFIHTAPDGRGRDAYVQWPPNLWERLRDRLPQEHAFGVWRLIRELERVGWITETSPSVLAGEFGNRRRAPLLGIVVANRAIPVSAYPAPEKVGQIVEDYWRQGRDCVAVVCASGDLDTMVSEIRSWMLARPQRPDIAALVLEEPSYDPVVVHPQDNSITPRAVSRAYVSKLVENPIRQN